MGAKRRMRSSSYTKYGACGKDVGGYLIRGMLKCKNGVHEIAKMYFQQGQMNAKCITLADCIEKNGVMQDKM